MITTMMIMEAVAAMALDPEAQRKHRIMVVITSRSGYAEPHAALRTS